MAWQIEEAGRKLSKIIDAAIAEGPQVIEAEGKEALVVLAIDEYRRLASGVDRPEAPA
jgi:prevent-host-death family protein